MKAIIRVAFFLAIGLIATGATAQAKDPLQKVEHLVVIFLENHSFDNLFGIFPGADGIFNAGAAAVQVDEAGKPYHFLPGVIDTRGALRNGIYDRNPVYDARFPPKLLNGPFLIDRYVPPGEFTGDLVHRFWQEQAQINKLKGASKGKMNRFAGISDAGGLTMGYFDISGSTLWNLAKEYTLADNMYHSAFGGSFLNHIFFVCSCALQWKGLPEHKAEKLRRAEILYKDNFVVNTIQPQHLHDKNETLLLPPQVSPAHLGDRLGDKVSWKWYSGGFAAALTGNPDPTFQFHHQPLMYWQQFEPGQKAQRDHLQDLRDLYEDIENDTLPKVAIYKPLGRDNLHPGYANLTHGDAHLDGLLRRLKNSKAWPKMLVIITFDEHGGYWDHVPPFERDDLGPGSRVPLIAVGTMVKRGFIDHTRYDFGSILRTIQKRWDVEPVDKNIDGRSNPLTNLLE